MPYAQEIADADDDTIPLYSWGSAVLACTYRRLYKASRQNDRNIVLTGCPILLQLWSYERIAIDRPIIDQSPYTPDMYGDTEDDRPTMGTLWYSRQYGPDKNLYSMYTMVIHCSPNIFIMDT